MKVIWAVGLVVACESQPAAMARPDPRPIRGGSGGIEEPPVDASAVDASGPADVAADAQRGTGGGGRGASDVAADVGGSSTEGAPPAGGWVGTGGAPGTGGTEVDASVAPLPWVCRDYVTYCSCWRGSDIPGVGTLVNRCASFCCLAQGAGCVCESPIASGDAAPSCWRTTDAQVPFGSTLSDRCP